MTMMHSDEDARECIRMLVHVIRQANTGSSPVDHGQLAHMRKVVRLLSLSDEQLAAMQPSERQSVGHIRNAAVQKMKLARTVQGSGSPCFAPVTSMSASSLPYPHSTSTASSSSPIEIMPVGSHPGGSKFAAQESPCVGGLAHSAPGSFNMASLEASRAMPPPTFYTRKLSGSPQTHFQR
uniref:Uncharacterized protein n=1 Tax=Coccolithus braarudii TaxID=221442 RepID=A0A7S0Q2E1_9EUKA|mmetsp:Transcript_29729/g.63970  ORF Transcript_29729/g.63970 Transcript_29729/m.63970 type:complete len:180 (+) Transcript_29729:266-805(+)